MYNKLVVKIGTNVLTRPNGLIDITTISQLVDQIASMKNKGVQVILVSSGAVGAGRSIVPMPQTVNKVVQRQVLSAVGQVALMQTYFDLFARYKLFCAQVLATKEDFRDRTHYLNMKTCFQALLRDDIIPIVNENDVIAVSELMFTDNDELAGLIAAMTNADALVILSSVDGVMDGPLDDPDTKIIPTIDPNSKQFFSYVQPSKSSFGRGGMQTKMRIAQKAAKVGIDTFIANGKRDNILLDIVQGNYIGTRFVSQEQLSNVKKWLAYSEDRKGKVTINEGAVEAISSNTKVSSLLLVGVTAVSGDFEKGDIIDVLDEDGAVVGMGISQYSADYVNKNKGAKGKKPLVHYDYLFIEKNMI